MSHSVLHVARTKGYSFEIFSGIWALNFITTSRDFFILFKFYLLFSPRNFNQPHSIFFLFNEKKKWGRQKSFKKIFKIVCDISHDMCFKIYIHMMCSTKQDDKKNLSNSVGDFCNHLIWRHIYDRKKYLASFEKILNEIEFDTSESV